MSVTEINTVLNDQQGQQLGAYLQDVEIVGDFRNVKRIRKLFENSSVKIKVKEQERPTLRDTFQWDEDSKDTCTETYFDGDGDLDSTCGTLTRSPTRNICVSSDDNSSGLDSEEDYRTSTPDSNRASPSPDGSRVSTPSVSPEVRNRRNMILVQSRIKNLGDKRLITPTRLYLKEATFMKHKTHYYIFFLFDDLLVITRTKVNPELVSPGAPRQVKFYKALDLKYLTVEAIPDSSKGTHLLKFHYSKSKAKKWKRVFSSPTRDQKDDWFSQLRTLRDQLTMGPNFLALFKSVY